MNGQQIKLRKSHICIRWHWDQFIIGAWWIFASKERPVFEFFFAFLGMTIHFAQQTIPAILLNPDSQNESS